MIKDWNIPQILLEIDKIFLAENDPYMDGFVTWGCKQDLYRILWHVERRLDMCGNYADIEEDFISKHREQEIYKKLSGAIK